MSWNLSKNMFWGKLMTFVEQNWKWQSTLCSLHQLIWRSSSFWCKNECLSSDRQHFVTRDLYAWRKVFLEDIEQASWYLQKNRHIFINENMKWWRFILFKVEYFVCTIVILQKKSWGISSLWSYQYFNNSSFIQNNKCHPITWLLLAMSPL